jgi:RimJ/RimL family protein N-acetyltransferase
MLAHYPKEIKIKDGTELTIRPVARDDEEALVEFFFQIPEEERWYRRQKLTDPAVLHKWIETPDYSRIVPIVAVHPETGNIVANVTLLLSRSGSMRHVAHLRIIVHPYYRNQRLSGLMIHDAAKLATGLGIEKLVAEFVVGVEDPVMAYARKLDFHEAGILRQYVKDPEGNRRDVIIMVRNLLQDWGDF